MTAVSERKRDLLERASRKLTGNLAHQAIFGKTPVQLTPWPETGQLTRRTPSYLVGMVAVRPELQASDMKRALEREDCDPVVQLWTAAGWQIPDGQRPEIALRNDGSLVITAPWPADLQTGDAPLDTLAGVTPSNKRGRFIVGPDTAGDVVTLEFGIEKKSPHIVHHCGIFGLTGQGKSYFMKSLLWQLCQHPGSQIIIIDWKGSDGVNYIRNIPGQVGPVVIADLDQSRAALQYAVLECAHRNHTVSENHLERYEGPPLYVCVSEFALLTAKIIGLADAASIFMLAYLAMLGRSAGVHLIMDTQHASLDNFGSPVIRNMLDFVQCYRTKNQYDTLAALPPGADVRPYLTLTQPGDGYTFVDGRGRRTLSAYVRSEQMNKIIDSAKPLLAEWPEFDANTLEGFEQPRTAGQPAKGFDAGEIAAALAVLKRPGDKKRLLRQECGAMGNERASALLALARELDSELDARGYCAPSENPSGN